MEFNYGSRTIRQAQTNIDVFGIDPSAAAEEAPPPAEETPAPTPSGSFQNRRSIESQHKFDCPTGHTYCWTGERQEYACMDTSSDVTGMFLSFFPPVSLPSLIHESRRNVADLQHVVDVLTPLAMTNPEEIVLQ